MKTSSPSAGGGAGSRPQQQESCNLLTFTGHPDDVFALPDNPPSADYRGAVRAGLMECGLSPADADAYLDERTGRQGGDTGACR